MTYEEITELATAHGWAYGGVGREMWGEFEMTYLSTPLNKRQITYLYWMKTGYYEKVAHCVKKYLMARKELNAAVASDDLLCVSYKAEAVSDAAIALNAAIEAAVIVYNNRPSSQE